MGVGKGGLVSHDSCGFRLPFWDQVSQYGKRKPLGVPVARGNSAEGDFDSGHLVGSQVDQDRVVLNR